MPSSCGTGWPIPSRSAGRTCPCWTGRRLAARDAGETERALALTKQALTETPDDAPVTDVIHRWTERGQRLSSLMRPGAVESLQTAADLLPADAEPKFRAKVLNELAMVATLSGVDARTWRGKP